MNKIQIDAHAKINLALAIKFKRDDGFHELESIFQEVEFGDRLTIGQTKGINFTTNSTLIPVDDSNLCNRAAQIMIEKFKLEGLDIYLDKRIPVGAGLGGGSSDAAAVIRGCLQLFNLEIKREQLVEIAAGLGSDVPFFLQGGTAYIKGRGEQLKGIKMTSDYFILLVFPPVAISTIWAYKNLNLALTKNVHSSKFTGFKFQNISISGFASGFFNDFEKLIYSVYPELMQIKQMIYDTGAEFASLSGSGSTVFGVYGTREKIDKALVDIGRIHECCITLPVSHDSR